MNHYCTGQEQAIFDNYARGNGQGHDQRASAPDAYLSTGTIICL